MTQTKSTRKKKIILVLLVLVLLALIAVTVWAIFFREPEPILPPDYPPQNVDPGQKPIPDDEGGKIESPTGGGAVNITYSTAFNADLSDGNVKFYYANPARSNQNVAIAVVIGEEVICRSELVTPGNMITVLPLLEDAKERLTVGGYEAELIIYCYHPQTGEKAMVDTRAPITLNVAE